MMCLPLRPAIRILCHSALVDLWRQSKHCMACFPRLHIIIGYVYAHIPLASYWFHAMREKSM